MGSKKKSARAQICPLENMRLLSQIPDVGPEEGGSMVRELNILSVVFVFAFLGAIVIGVF